MATRIDTINTKVDEAIAAAEAEDFETAVLKLHSAKALLATIPSRSAKGEGELEFDANAIDSLIATYERRRGAKLGVQTTKIEFAQPTE